MKHVPVHGWRASGSGSLRRRARESARMALLCVALVLVCVACATPVADIKAHPEEYAGKVVSVRGIVVDALNVPGVELSFYSLSDGTARMPVVARERRVEGAEVTVEVRVIAIAATAASDQAARAVDELANFLIERDIVARGNARNVARRIMRAVRNAGEGVTGSYLLVETS